MTDLLQLISDLQEEKRKKHIVPDHILFTDLKNKAERDISEDLNDLFKSGKIGVVKTVNQKAVYVIE